MARRRSTHRPARSNTPRPGSRLARKIRTPLRRGARKLESLRHDLHGDNKGAKKPLRERWGVWQDLVRLQDSAGMVVESTYGIWTELSKLVDYGFATAKELFQGPEETHRRSRRFTPKPANGKGSSSGEAVVAATSYTPMPPV